MKTFFLIIKIFLLWILLPLVLGLVFVVLPCYTLGEIGSTRLWCGYKDFPPYAGTQFLVGLALGFGIALFFTLRARSRSKAQL
jgi:hypothetical protein